MTKYAQSKERDEIYLLPFNKRNRHPIRQFVEYFIVGNKVLILWLQ